MSVDAPDFEVERFERVIAGSGTVLLRLAGRWRADQLERLAPPMLLLGDGPRTRRLAPLPGPDDAAPMAGPDPPAWRAAFSTPVAQFSDSPLAYSLETSRGIVGLPRPQEAGRRAPKPAPAIDPAVLREERRRREDAERAAEERRRAMAALEARLETERAARGAAEGAAREARDELVRLRAQADTATRSS